MSHITISKDFTFEASHVLPKHPGKCSQLHGHSWKLTVTIIGQVNRETGFVMDYGTLKEIVDEHIIKKLDHQHLGYGQAATNAGDVCEYMWVPPFGNTFYPSSENLVAKIADILVYPFVKHAVRLYEVELKETCTSAARWSCNDYKGLIP